jgi:hypothetical protein
MKSIDLNEIDQDLLYRAIRDGVAEAIIDIARNCTDAPCADFYDHIKLGVKEAVDAKL